MGDVYLTHGHGAVQESVSREALAGQSIVFASWLNESEGTMSSIALDDLSRPEFDALVGYVRSTDTKLARTASLHKGKAFIPFRNTNVQIYDDRATWANAQHLVRAAHKYDCPLLWNKLVTAISTHPSAETVAALDAVPDVEPAQWVSGTVASWCAEHALSREGSVSWSDALCAAVFRVQAQNAALAPPPAANGAPRPN